MRLRRTSALARPLSCCVGLSETNRAPAVGQADRLLPGRRDSRTSRERTGADHSALCRIGGHCWLCSSEQHHRPGAKTKRHANESIRQTRHGC